MSTIGADPKAPEPGYMKRWTLQSLELFRHSAHAMIFMTLAFVVLGIAMFMLNYMSGFNFAMSALTDGIASAGSIAIVLVTVRMVISVDGHPAMPLRDTLLAGKEVMLVIFCLSSFFAFIMGALPEPAPSEDGGGSIMLFDLSNPEPFFTYVNILLLAGHMSFWLFAIAAFIVNIFIAGLISGMNITSVWQLFYLDQVTMRKMPKVYFQMRLLMMIVPLASMVLLPQIMLPFISFFVVLFYYVASREIFGGIGENGIKKAETKFVPSMSGA